MTTTRYFLGIDAGGSHCRARIADATGRLIGSGATGPANARVGMEQLRATLDAAIAQAAAEAGLTADDLRDTSAGMGIAGISRPGVREALAALDWPFASVTYVTDAVIANLGAHRGADGAILILGTGSIAQLRINGTDVAIGGYGFPISDEGSGAALGLSAVRHALRALDGRSQRTPLSLAVSDRFGHAIPQAIAWMDRATPRDYAALAPLVMDHAEAGDAIARSIVEDAAAHVERFIETVFERGAPSCVLMGGLAPRLRPWLRARTVAQLGEAQGDALDGALLLAGLPGDARAG
ncbi:MULTISPECIES: BadF/BadG/BcrA/BcrD ATPase family protein [Sphingomonas]|uniref:BadF/BadG/BcrA/BcrD ATPase family protein n=1 Tax=Sphingomonas TaxID=13687 RepID=UPI0008322C78|nr:MULTISPECIES: BadF/BadG/BcrA/BcrD ATPase family protein [Sphingomonas]MBY0300962.1 ATPase [Sphingomonas ginsenosidimutans]